MRPRTRRDANARAGFYRLISDRSAFLPRRPAIRATYLVCYDIADDKRLRRVFQTCRRFGDHIQYSVFECQLTAADMATFKTALDGIIHHTEDQVLFVHLGPSAGRGDRQIAALGKPYTNIDAPCIVI